MTEQCRYRNCISLTRGSAVDRLHNSRTPATRSPFRTLWPRDLDLWTFYMYLILMGGRGFVMNYPCAKFGDFSFSRFDFIVRTNKQTNKQTNRHTHTYIHRIIVIINRLRIGHTRLTHFYLLAGGDQPECVTYQCPLTIKHILIECSDFRDIRNKYFVASTIYLLFERISMRNVINYIKETHFLQLTLMFVTCFLS